MKPRILRAWLVGTVFSSCTFGLITSAAAQSAPAPSSATPIATPIPTQGLATITVVARKKTENLQKVPLSVTAITKKVLQQAHVENLHDVIALTPGVNIADAGAEAVTSITIRGDTDQTFGVNIPDVASFLDGTYLRDSTAINVAAAPLQDVEVIKGPVSALYGRDAYAGVINYILARPTATPHADISETAGDDGKSELKGDISGPVYGDKVLGEVFGDYDVFNGTYHDNISGVNAGGYQKKDLGALLDFNWSDNLTTHLDFYYGDDYFNSPAVEGLTPNCGSGTEVEPNGAPTYTAQNLYCGQVKTNGTVNVGSDPAAGNPGNVRRTFYGSMHNTASYDWGTIDAITGAAQVDERAIQLFDASSTGQPFQLAYAATPGIPNGNYALEHSFYGSGSNTGNFSQELRYSSPQNERLRYGAGGFFYDESRYDLSAASVSELNIPTGQVLDDANSFFGTPTGAVGPNVTTDKHTTNEEAGFANAEFDILPNLTVASQYRYTWEQQYFDITGNEYTGPENVNYTSHEQYFATNESLRWFPIPNQMLYFAFANGVKPGGFNSGAPAADAAFGAESDLSFEGGFKTQFLENLFQLDGTAYHVDVNNLQLYVPLANGSEYIFGEGKTANTGFEVDARAMPVEGLTLTGGVNYNNPTFDAGSYDAADAYNCAEIPACLATEKTVGGLLEQPVGGNTVPLSSKLTFTATAEYDFLVAEQYPAYVRGDYSYKSSQFTDPSNLTSIGAQNDLDMFAGISKGRYTLSVYVKNITNDESADFFQYDTTLDYFNKIPTVVLNPGRTFAFTVAAKF
jgi:iron complex outermembrane receptor protein